jgi:hypothetical protein
MGELITAMCHSQFGYFTHNACNVEVFWRVDRSNTLPGKKFTIFFWDDSTDNDRGIYAFCAKTAHHIGNKL